ncbi:L-serine ammonia-lyase [Gloeobacter violaceus]|uniref:L-serine dehydratase n=1 Tax=Gloeobacter violaceus (strain ATCC 29082 / PCC 7421) TaxID=251221 RepID=Q7NI26_GLOVI|nr:L-serine dehydratase [Gloeobacter violaceus PCC 7421]
MGAITTSIFELFKVGPGPSSSHTIGPMKAAFDFLIRINALDDTQVLAASAVEAFLFGSLSATGKGHGTDRAVIAGLLGWTPEGCDPVAFSALLSDDNEHYFVAIHDRRIPISAANIHFVKGQQDFPFSNTMILRLMGDDSVLFEQEYYSIGGGFIQRKGEDAQAGPPVEPPYGYGTMKELKAQMTTHSLGLDEVILANEMVITGQGRKQIYRRIDDIFDFMHRAVRRGLKSEGILPGTIRLERKAPGLHRTARALRGNPDSFLVFLNAYSLAASEENAAGRIVVTAPTSGASGVIPGVSYLLKKHYRYDKQKLRSGLLAAAAVGFLVKHNASISGAEMGCMGEVGTAAAMGAAMLAHCAGHPIEVVEAAAEIAIEHHLGMTCDPIGGYVQIPCIERNAMGAVKAYNAYLLASAGSSSKQKISLDNVIRVMRATGLDMSRKYKETSEAGLALSSTEC